MDIKFLSAVIFVKDLQAARNFYENLLGQKVATDHGVNVGYQAGFALWQNAHACEIIFGAETTPEPGPLGRRNFELYFETENLEPVLEQFTRAGVQFVHPLFEQPWGQRVFRVYDPDGHVVEVGEPMSAPILRFLAAGLSMEQIAERTSMPLEIVRQVAEVGMGEAQ
jgi:catechol 2,3-dioxygenase-like lactoylglutathione lyase family enzyme